MTRILYWNLENFSVDKFWRTAWKRGHDGMMHGFEAQDAIDRRAYFFRALDNYLANGSPAHIARVPEIVVIVELESGNTGRGTLVTGNGPAATMELVDEIRHWTGNNNWMAVPPLFTGPKEGVIVLYNSTNLIFTGPNVWPGGAGPSAIPGAPPGVLPAAPASPYPAGWNAYIRTGALNRPVPAGAMHNANRWENQMAARVAGFTSSGGAGLTPPVGEVLGAPAAGTLMDPQLSPRTPYMVTFFRPALAPAAAENITLFAIHAPASGNAHAHMTALACTEQIAAAPAANERKVVVGDLNFNLFTNAGGIPQRYTYFRQLLYNIGVFPPVAAPPPVPPPVVPPPAPPPFPYYDYFATHIAKEKDAENWSTIAQVRSYPGYAYTSGQQSCIDNILVRGGGLVNTTVLNAVVGSPLNVVPGGGPPAWLTPAMRGHFAIRCLCACYQPPNPIPTWTAPAYAAGMAASFQGWANFGRIRSTSDHLPILAEF